MGKRVKPLTGVTGFVPAQPKEIPIARGLTLSRVTGAVILIRQTAYRGANGSAAEANQ